ncbi:hsp70 family protein [Fimbriiglobus ruber]|uniref:Chaperone protein DnaK n=1 Tax=Fimbriiglobus ruber TaxID=1908690 RepID=A0A225E4R7_9BACT|nr:hsp70 family protein [Fimbriiglobus ruber]OWK43675.1 Chaperone protein DnaK [Fimbriiglobus ruber]
MARFLVGIDLGTTNSALAFVDLQAKPKAGGVKLNTFPIPQLVVAGEVREQQLLPSFLYLPGPHDLPPGAIALPWEPGATSAVGAFARNHGGKVPGRLVSSAKSWLCHPGVDRTSPLLPWGAPPDVPRLSPLEASARYLKHLVDAWNHTAGRRPEDRLEDQPVVLTVPASFDDVARNLTADAAKQAGLKNVSLLEEPQAAFYAWLGTHTPAEAGKLKPGMRCLVVDVGGGTSDFSLIRAGEEQGEMTFVRDAVGDHLLLGGDNMDLALAKAIEAKLPAGKLDAAQFGALVQACRSAKEALLGPNPPDHFPVTVVGKGRSVVSGTISINVTRADVTAALFDGFFPTVPYTDEPNRAARSGLQEMGLPYVADAAVTKHLAAFLRQHLPPGEVPNAILFNGGVFTPQVLRERVIEVMRPWFEVPGKPWHPLVLTTPSLDLAVAWGAAYLAWLKQSGGRRIGGGIPRSYYLGVSLADEKRSGAPAATDQPATPAKAVVCVVPRQLEEGNEVLIPAPEFELEIGRPVLFPLFTSTVRGDDKPGDIFELGPTQLLQLPPLHTILRGGRRSGVKRVPVTLAAKATEIGTLELYCVSREGNRWRLEFNVRDVVRDTPERPGEPAGDDRATLLDVFPEDKVQAAGELIRTCYATGAPTPPELPKSLEAALDTGRQEWPTGLCRRIWDFLAEVSDQRTKSPPHLSRWYNLVGFCLRPGFGDPLDRYRIEALWKLITTTTAATGATAKQPTVVEGGADYWIMWRRVSGGLNAALQQSLYARLRPTLLPSRGKPAPKPHANELAEMWRAAASLERLDARTKQHLGDELLRQIKRTPVPHYAFWALTRLGARQQFYGPLNTLLHPDVAQNWLEQLLDFAPTNDAERLGWGFCLAQLARRTGLRGADVSDDHRHGVARLLRTIQVPAGWPRMVEEVVEPEGDDQSRLFGEALPIGLRLAGG